MELASIVRALSHDGTPSGLGFAITDRNIVMPRYVIHYCLGLEPSAPFSSIRDYNIEAAFPFHSGNPQITFRIMHIDGNRGPDEIVILETLDPKLSEFITPAPIFIIRDSRLYFDREIRFFGFPEDLESGIFASGHLEGQVADGSVQVQTSFDISYGFGGAAIWDKESDSVIGILTKRWAANQRVAFMEPISIIEKNLSSDAMTPSISSSVRPQDRQRPKIFICHASEDSDTAMKLHEILREYGYAPWIDKIDILPGQDWDLAIRSAIDGSDFMIVILSKKSTLKHGYVQREFKLAVEYLQQIPEGQIYLIPVKIDDCDVPKQFASYQFVELEGRKSFDRIIRAIEFQTKTIQASRKSG